MNYIIKNQEDKNLVFLIVVSLITGLSVLRFVYIYGFNGSGYKFATQLLLNLFLIFIFQYKKKITVFFELIDDKRVDELFLPIGILTVSLIFIYFPFLFYNSDPGSFIQSSEYIIKGQILFFEISILAVLFLNFFLGRYAKTFLSIILCSLILTAFIWNIWNDPKLGAFANYQFQNEKILTKSSAKNFYLITFTFCLLISSVILFRIKKYVLKIMISVMILGVCASPLLVYERGNNTNLVNNGKQMISEELNEFLTFSKNGKNIIVIMLDMFSPSDLELLLRVDPKLNKQFSGFTWYKDTLSSGISTIFGKAPLLGGVEATPWRLNEDKTLSLEEKVNKAWSKFFNALVSKNFKIELNDNKWYSWFDPKYYNKKLLSNIIVNREESVLVDRWDARNNFKNEIKGNPSIFLSLYGLFKISPLNFKNFIYDKGMWLGKIDRSDDLEWSHRELPLLDALSTESHFKETSCNKFKFISTLLTHHPWNLNKQCKPSSNPINEGKYRSLGITWNSRLQSELCSLQLINKFLNKLKSKSVFENTMILIVSDHGVQTAYVPNGSHGLNENMVRDGSLLLVKPFGNSNLDLKISHDLTTNYDVPTIVENALNTLKREPWKDKERTRITVHGDWQRDLHPKNYYNIKELYSVKGSMFDANNWHKEF